MKKILSILLLLPFWVLGQVAPIKTVRIANATTTFSTNIAKGDEVTNLATGELWKANAGVLGTYTLTTGAAYFNKIAGEELVNTFSQRQILEDSLRVNGSAYFKGNASTNLQFIINNAIGTAKWYLLLGGSDEYQIKNQASQLMFQVDAAGNVSANNYISTVATGTKPISVVSTTLNDSLNADLLDGLHAAAFAVVADTVGIYHTNRAALNLVSGTNTGDQTITNSSDATTHTVTLSASGGSTQIVEGTGVGLATTGTGSAGVLTITNTGVVTEADPVYIADTSRIAFLNQPNIFTRKMVIGGTAPKTQDLYVQGSGELVLRDIVIKNRAWKIDHISTDSTLTIVSTDTTGTEIINALVLNSVNGFVGVKKTPLVALDVNGEINSENIKIHKPTQATLKIQTDTYASDITQNGGGGGFPYGTYVDLNVINNYQGSSAFGNINFITGDAGGSVVAATIGGGANKGNFSAIGTSINFTTSGTVLTVGVGADNGTVSAGIFTDRTKYYDGDALTAIKNIKGKDGEIDHTTLPEFSRTHLKKTKMLADSTEVQFIEEGRDLGAMVSILTKAVQQLTDIVETQKLEIADLKKIK